MIKLHNVQTTSPEVYHEGLEHKFDTCFVFARLQQTFKIDYRDPLSILEYGCRMVAKSKKSCLALVSLLSNEYILDEISNMISTGAPRSLRKNNPIIASTKLMEIIDKYLDKHDNSNHPGVHMVYKALIYQALLGYGLVLPSTDTLEVELRRELFPNWNDIRESVLYDGLLDVVREQQLDKAYESLSLDDNHIESLSSRLLLDPLKQQFRQIARKINQVFHLDHTLNIIGAACLLKISTPNPSLIDYQGLLGMSEYDVLCDNFTFISAFSKTLTSPDQIDQILSRVVVQDMLERIRVVVNRINTASEFIALPIAEVLTRSYIRHYADAANVLTGVTIQPIMTYAKQSAAVLSIFNTPKSQDHYPITRLEEIEPTMTSLTQSIRNVFSASSIFDKFNNQFIGVFTGISNIRGNDIGVPGETIDITASGEDFNAVRSFLLNKSSDVGINHSGAMPINAYILITVADESYLNHLAVACADNILIRPLRAGNTEVFDIAYRCTKRVPDTLRLLVTEFNTQGFVTTDAIDAITFSALATEKKSWVCEAVSVPYRGSCRKGSLTSYRKYDRLPLLSNPTRTLLTPIYWTTQWGNDQLEYCCNLFELLLNDTRFEDVFDSIFVVDDLVDEFTIHTPLYDAIQLANVFYEVKDAVGTALAQMLLQVYNSVPVIRMLVSTIERKMLFSISDLPTRRRIAESMRQGYFKPDLIIQVIGELLFRCGMIGQALYENWLTKLNPIITTHAKEIIRSAMAVEHVPAITTNVLAQAPLTKMSDI